jgi:hypothetical protein
MEDTRRLTRLIAIADEAYLRAREQVYDFFPPGAPIVRSVLTTRQRLALDELEMVEAELAEYRRLAYAA